MSNNDPLYDERGYFRDPLNTPASMATHCVGLPPGLVMANNALPPGILVVKNILDPETCDRLVTFAAGEKAVASTVEDLSQAGDQKYVSRQSTARVTEYIDIDGMRDEILALVSKFFLDWIEPFYKKTIEWFEYPEILRYNVGGYYWPHSDADNWIQDDQAWSRSLDRDLSILFYLNEEYEGGEIEFPNFRFRLTPERGMLVCFPSDHRFLHAARETTGGQRYVLVSWAAAAETERVREDPPARAIFLKR